MLYRNNMLRNNFPVLLFLFAFAWRAEAQLVSKSGIYSRRTLAVERQKQDQGLWKYTLTPLIGATPDSANEDRFQSALWVISTLMLKNDTTREMVNKLVKVYPLLGADTQEVLLAVIYGLYPNDYLEFADAYWSSASNGRLTGMLMAYLYRAAPSPHYLDLFNQHLQNRKAAGDSLPAVEHLLQSWQTDVFRPATEDWKTLLGHQKALGCKIVYSIQRPDRDYPGMAFVQNADGSFVKDDAGAIQTFVQLARSASNLPCFIRNGNTPQGIYRIAGTDVSTNQSIGPTPNLQLRMPNEVPLDSFVISKVPVAMGDSVTYPNQYAALLPGSWQVPAMYQSYDAGKIGRTEIISHGTTIDPSYYKQYSFYPNTPSLGCLCAPETWDPQSGKLLASEQLNLVNAFLSTPGPDGYLFVIETSARNAAVTREEILQIISAKAY